MTWVELNRMVRDAKRATDELAECCAKCKHVGRVVQWDRSPSAQCCLGAPGAYSVTETKTSRLAPRPAGKELVVVNQSTVSCSFPPVWPWDRCGMFELAPESEFLFREAGSSS